MKNWLSFLLLLLWGLSGAGARVWRSGLSINVWVIDCRQTTGLCCFRGRDSATSVLKSWLGYAGQRMHLPLTETDNNHTNNL